MKEAKENEVAEILEYLKKDIADCLYMYIDIKKYGLNNPHMKVWIERDKKDDSLKTVVMNYHGSIQIYERTDDWNKEWIKELLLKEKIKMVSGKETVIKELAAMLGNTYDNSFGSVYQLKEYRKFDNVETVEYAGENDVQEIAALICSDEAFTANYKIEALAEQLLERMNSGMGRNAVIRKDGKIVAHIATYAEYENIAVTSGLIVHPDYRKSGYGFITEGYLVNELLKENKDVYTFVLEPKRAALLDAVGGKLCGKYGKLTLKKDMPDLIL